MPELSDAPSRIEAAGRPSKTIEECVGLVRTDEARMSVARMVSPPGWSEPGQRAAFNQFTIDHDGELLVEHRGRPGDRRRPGDSHTALGVGAARHAGRGRDHRAVPAGLHEVDGRSPRGGSGLAYHR